MAPLSFIELVDTYTLNVTGVLHLGTNSNIRIAQHGKEAADYAEFTDNVVWVEANPQLLRRLEQCVGRYGQRVIQALIGDRDGQDTRFNVAINGKPVNEIMLKSVRLDTLMRHYGTWTDLNYLHIGLEGAELMALRGGTKYLSHVQYIYSNSPPMPKPEEYEDFLSEFMRVESYFWVRRERRY